MTANVWTDGVLELHPVALPVLDALQRGDRAHAQALLPAVVILTAHCVSATCVRTWQRRHAQIRADPREAAWVTRLVIQRSTTTLVGRAGFHGQPDANGMVEIGYEIDPAYRRLGYGAAVIRILLDVARQDDRVRVVRASAGIHNAVSRGMIQRAGFTKIGEEMDNEDGLEDVFELAVAASPEGASNSRTAAAAEADDEAPQPDEP